jgi:hypothetical protein
MFYNHLPNFIFRKLNLGTKTQKEIVLKSIRVLFLLLGLNLFLFPSFGQTPAQTLVTGTSFNPRNIDPDKTYYSEPEIEYYGTAPTRISVGIPLTPDADDGTFVSDYQYGITENPINLDGERFIDRPDDFMLTFSPVGSENNDPPVFTYNVSGLVPNSDVTVVVEYCSPIDYLFYFNNGIYNPGPDTKAKPLYTIPGNDSRIGMTDIVVGTCNTYIITGEATNSGSFSISIFPDGNRVDYNSISISQIDIYGELDPKISSSQGTNVCVNEQIQLRPQSISAGTYSWEVNTGSSWQPLSSSITALYEITAVQTYRFRLTQTTPDGKTFQSEVFEVQSRACCDGGQARKTIFLDDFGRADMSDGLTFYVWDYSDILNPVERQITTTHPFRYPLDPPPAGFLFGIPANGPSTEPNLGVLDDRYAVVANLNDTYIQSWSRAIGGVGGTQTYDRSGTPEGAALFLNPEANRNGDVLYERTINNLCSGKTLEFEAWINKYTNDNAAEVLVSIQEVGINSTIQTFPVDANGPDWESVNASFDMIGTSLHFKITNNTNLRAGNDIILDDIKITTCAPPLVNIFFDIPTLATEIEVCEEPLPLFASYSSLFSSYYANSPRFQFQWTLTPTDYNSWQDIGSYGPIDNFEFPNFKEEAIFASLDNETNVYFRVIAASEQQFIDGIPLDANPNDPCLNFSVSQPIEATVACAVCEKPEPFELISSTDKFDLCPGEDLELTADTDQLDAALFDFTWSRSVGNGTPTVVAGPLANLVNSTLTVDYSDFGTEESLTYTLLIRDKAMNDEQLCWEQHFVTINKRAIPTYTFSDDKTYCEGETIEPVEISIVGETETGEDDFEFTYTYTPSTGPVVSTDVTTGDATYSITDPLAGTYRISAIADKYCTGEVITTENTTIVINPVPEATLDPSALAYCGTTSDISITVEPFTGVDLTGASYQWYKDDVEFGSVTSDNIINNVLEGVYYAVITLNDCEYTTDPVTITSAPTPVFTVTGGGSYCPDDLTRDPIVITMTNGTGNFTFTWRRGAEPPVTGVVSTGATYEISDPSEGEYTVTSLVNEAGCEATDYTPSTEVIDLPAPSLSISPITGICASQTTYDISGFVTAGTGTLSYSIDNDASVNSSGVITHNGANTYELVVILGSTEGCSNRKTAPVVVNSLPEVTLANREVCSGIDLSLAPTVTGGTSPYSYAWTGAGWSDLNSAIVATPTFNANLTTQTERELILTVTDANNCVGTATIDVTVYPNPVVSLAADDIEFCANESAGELITATITGTSETGGTGTFAGSGIGSTTNTTTVFTALDAGTSGSPHTITFDYVTDKGCISNTANIEMTVNSLPNITLTPIREDACVSGNNSGAITFSTTGTSATGTFEYSSTTATVDPTSGELVPSLANAGTHTVQLKYTDDNGCEVIETSEVTVHALPTVSFVDVPTEICLSADPINLTVNPTGGTYTPAVNPFDPSDNGAGSHTIEYTYSDTYECENIATHTIEVIEVTPPTVDAPNPKTVVLLSGGGLSEATTLSASLTVATNFIDWRNANNTTTLESNSQTFDTELTDADPADTYNYSVVEGQTLSNGDICYSEPVTATLILSNCPASTPVVVDPFYCVGYDGAIEVSTTSTPATDGKISWFTFDPVGQSGAGLADISDNELSHTITSMNTNTANTYTLYAAEYDLGNDCWSAGKLVTVSVVDTPAVTIPVPFDVCARDGLVNIAVTPLSGTMSGDIGGLNATARQWNPNSPVMTEAERTIAITYEVGQNHGSGTGETTCYSRPVTRITAHYMEQPTADDKVWLITDIANIPVDFMEATLTSTGTEINWYADATLSTHLATGLTYDPDRVALQAEVPAGALSYEKSYWITQTDAFGCVSEPVEVILNLVDCPFGEPTVPGVVICQSNTASSYPDITAVVPDITTTPTAWEWIATDNTVVNTTATYNDGNNLLSHGTTTYNVRYQALETNSGNLCWSPPQEVTVVVNPLPVITFDASNPTLVCYDAGTTQIGVSVDNHGFGKQSDSWSIDGNVAGITGGFLNPTFNGATTGTYDIEYIYTDNNGCENSAIFPVTIQYSPKPDAADHLGITIDPQPIELLATGLDSDVESVNWYSGSSIVSNDNPFVTSDDPSAVGVYFYDVTQTINGCESEKKENVKVEIISCPVPRPDASGRVMCDYEDAPELTASINLNPSAWGDANGRPTEIVPVELRWYDADNNLVGTGSSFTPIVGTHVDTSQVEALFRVSEYNPNITPIGCEGPKRDVLIGILTADPVTVNSINELCSNDPTTSFMATSNHSGFKWFAQEPSYPAIETFLNDLTVFTPNNYTETSTIGNHIVYVLGSKNLSYPSIATTRTCESRAVAIPFEIKAVPDAPVLTVDPFCQGETNTTIVASTSTNNTDIRWYSTPTTINTLATAQVEYTPSVTAHGEYTYYASQTIRGCESSRASVDYIIKPNPPRPTVEPQPNICETNENPTLSVSSDEVSPTFNWYNRNGELVSNNDTYTHVIDGAGTIRYEISQTVDGCEGEKQRLQFTIDAVPSDPIVTNQTMCADDNIPMLRTDIASDEWRYTDDLSIEPFLSGQYTYRPTSTDTANAVNGEVVYHVVRRNGTCYSNIVPVKLTIVPNPSFDIVTIPTQCFGSEGKDLKIENETPFYNPATTSLVWRKGGNVIAEGNDVKPNQEMLSTGLNFIEATYTSNTNGKECSTTKDEPYLIKARPLPAYMDAYPICKGEFLTQNDSVYMPILGINLDDYVSWSSAAIYDSTEQYSSLVAIDGLELQQIVEEKVKIYINVVDGELGGDCQTTSIVELTVAEQPNTQIRGRNKVCEQSYQETYTIDEYTPTSYYDWQYKGTPRLTRLVSDNGAAYAIDWASQGIDTIYLRETTQYGCIAEDSMIVTVAVSPEVDFEWEFPGAGMKVVFFNLSEQDSIFDYDSVIPVTYNSYWYYGRESDAFPNIHNYEQRRRTDTIAYKYGTYDVKLEVINDHGCVVEKEWQIFVDVNSGLYIPNAFSPSNVASGVRTFLPRGYNLTEYEMSIYDSWGNLIFYTDKLNSKGMPIEGWDGTYNGMPLKTDNYVWKINAKFVDGSEWKGIEDRNGKSKKYGNVVLIR